MVPAHGDPFEHSLEEDSLLIGRASDCDLVIADRFLSRRHARIYRDGERWMVEDHGSRNGTLVNGERITGPVAVEPGDELRLSGSVIHLERGTQKYSDTRSEASDISEHTIFRRASDVMDSQPSFEDTASDPESTRRYTERLRMLNDVHLALSRPIELDTLLEMILKRAFEHLGPEEGVIYLRQPEGDYFQAAKLASDDAGVHPFSQTLVREVADKGLAALVLDVHSDERFAAAQSILGAGIRSLVAAPLLDDEGSLGMIALSSRVQKRQFAEEDMELLVSLASVAALRVRNLALATEAAERRRLENELRLARQIQITLLPEKLPEIPGYEIYAGNIPSSGVSGDYYELVERDGGNEVVFMLTDVSGKGIAASLLTASLEALAADPIESGQPPDQICTILSRRLFRRTPPAKYATAFVCDLRPESGRLRYANAGHNAGLVVRAGGEVEQLGPTGLPIGLMESSAYTAGELILGPGEQLVLYSDGITEASDPDDEEYGLERLIDVCSTHHGLAPGKLRREIEADLERFVRGVPYADDRTLLIVRRRPA